MNLAPPHFSEEEWADYVRDTLPDSRRPAVQGHLDSGCGQCIALHGLWSAVQGAARADARYEPSPDTMRVARALFSARQPSGRFARAFEGAKLLFDSQLMPAAAGLRSASAVARHFVHSFGNYLVDTQIQDGEKGRTSQLIGQITTEGGSDVRFEGAPVLLLRQMEIIARATTNRLGEFHLQFTGATAGLSVAVGLKDGGTVINLDTPRTQS